MDPIPSQVSYVDDSATVAGPQQPAVVEYDSGINQGQAETTTSAVTEQIHGDTRNKTEDAELSEIVEEKLDSSPDTQNLSENLSEGSENSSKPASRTARPNSAHQGVSDAGSIEPSRRVAAAEVEDTEAFSEVDNLATEDAAPVVFRNESKKEKTSKSLTRAERIQSPELPRATPPSNIGDYITQHITYPEAARSQSIMGTVKLWFLVDQDGSLSDFQVVSGPGYGCEQEAIRVLETGPAWIPAQINGSSVQSKGEIEIQFPARN